VAIQYNSNYDETLPFSDVTRQIHLTTAVEQTFAIPGTETTQYQALFSYNDISNVFVCLNATPVIPGANTVGSQQYNEFKPEKRYVKGGDVLHFITPDATAYMGVSLRTLQGS
jgi:hypothetical protein